MPPSGGCAMHTSPLVVPTHPARTSASIHISVRWRVMGMYTESGSCAGRPAPDRESLPFFAAPGGIHPCSIRPGSKTRRAALASVAALSQTTIVLPHASVLPLSCLMVDLVGLLQVVVAEVDIRIDGRLNASVAEPLLDICSIPTVPDYLGR